MGCDVVFSSRRERTLAETSGIPWVPLDELVATSQLVVVAVALTPETRQLLSRDRIMRLPEGSFIVNVARGAVIDEVALIDALRSGHVAGAALDVFESEPLPADSPLREIDRVILSPHSSGNTPESRQRLFEAVRENLKRAVTGEPVRWVVNDVSPNIVRRA
jgi:D-3-phosphoglycerate dehydrogenase